MSKALQPIEQRIVVFYDDELTAVLVDVDGRQVVYVPIRPICDFLGVDRRGQQQRVERDSVLSDVSRIVNVTSSGGVTPPQGRIMLCLPLEFINGFLFGINANRVKPEVRERLRRYQRECYRVLADAFLTRSMETAVSSSVGTLLQVREMGLAIARMAEEQIEFDNRLTKTENRLDKAAAVFGSLTKRITTLEERVGGPGNPVTMEQASQVSEAVKAVAMATPEKNFGKVYGELYRRFGITSYKLLPAKHFAEAMQFLTEWYLNQSGDKEAPF